MGDLERTGYEKYKGQRKPTLGPTQHGVEMEGSIYSSGQIRYRFPAVGCQDAGLIRCEAPGASHNETAMLLVRKTNQIVTDGQNMELTLSVRASSKEVKGCRISKHQLPAEEELKEFRALPKAPVDDDDTADTVSQLSVHVYEEVLDDAAVAVRFIIIIITVVVIIIIIIIIIIITTTTTIVIIIIINNNKINQL
nr:hypothetical protein BaRGS_032528 [Batillaria attramentaria]